MTKKISLTFPPTHTDEDIQYLYDEYRKRYPEKFREWVEIERNFKEKDDPLREIAREGLQFLRELCQWDSTFALSSAWFDIRKKVTELAQSDDEA